MSVDYFAELKRLRALRNSYPRTPNVIDEDEWQRLGKWYSPSGFKLRGDVRFIGDQPPRTKIKAYKYDPTKARSTEALARIQSSIAH